jgi:predicted small lipoprotein YifL
MKTRAACAALVLLCVIGCGLKGPLYLPDHAGAVVTRPAPGAQDTGATAPAQQPGATQQPAAPQQPGGTPPKKNSGKDDDASQK